MLKNREEEEKKVRESGRKRWGRKKRKVGKIHVIERKRERSGLFPRLQRNNGMPYATQGEGEAQLLLLPGFQEAVVWASEWHRSGTLWSAHR